MVLEYRVGWNVGGANPGFTVLHGRSQSAPGDQEAAEEMGERARLLFDAIKALLPSAVTLTFPGEAIELNTTTGVLEDVYTFTAPASVVGTGSTVFGWPAGVRYEWRSSAIVFGRRLRGRTFIVPTISSAFDTNGTLTSSALTTLAAGSTAYLGGTAGVAVSPAIWSRTHGILGDITSTLIPDEVSVLRSRRD